MCIRDRQGAMIVWELENCVYLENFAIETKMRGQGLGTYLSLIHIFHWISLILRLKRQL